MRVSDGVPRVEPSIVQLDTSCPAGVQRSHTDGVSVAVEPSSTVTLEGSSPRGQVRTEGVVRQGVPLRALGSGQCMSDQPTPDQPDEQHVQEADAGALRDGERAADVMAAGPGDPAPPAGTTGEDARAAVRAATGAGGSSTADPGRQNPIIPGEGRL